MKNKLKKSLTFGILIFGVSLLFTNCQKEDDNQSTSDLENKNNSISNVSIEDILNQSLLSQKEFGFKSKKDVASKKKFNLPTLELASSKGLKKNDEGENHYVFLLKRTDKTDSYFYNLVVQERDGNLEKFIYKYPLDKSEPIQITKLNNDNNQSENKSLASKVPVATHTDLGGDCTKTRLYDVTPCPCVGHIDPEVCQCPVQPVWRFLEERILCVNLDDYLLVTGGGGDDPDIDTSGGITISDQLGCFINSQGLTECPPPDENPVFDIPQTPLPTLEPDFDLGIGNSFLIGQLDLTNLQKDWLEKLENQNFKSDIHDYLSQFIFTIQFNDAKEFAQLAIVALMSGEISNFEEAKYISEIDFAPNIDNTDKIDPNEELKCFDLTKGAKLTVYVQQPLENSNRLIGPNQVGHAFIGIEQNGIIRQFGFYPEKGANGARVAVGKTYDSELRSNNNYLYHVSISQDILSSQLTTIINYVKSFPKKYDVNDYACTDFAIKIGNLGGMYLPSTTVESWPFEGRSPGQLGQEIRSMNSDSIKTIKKAKENSPNKEGECN